MLDRRPWLVAALTAVTVLGAGRSAPAQRDDDDAPEEAAQVVPNNVVFWNMQNFDQWVFGNVGGNAAAGRTRLDSLLALKVDEVDRACRLTDAQKEKLRLVGRGDVKRLLERVEEKRKAFLLIRSDQQKFQSFYQELQPLQTTLQRGPFEEGSLFSKAVLKALERDQAAVYEKARRERTSFHSRAKLGLAESMIDGTAGLTADQRRRLREVLAAEVRPPKKSGPYDYYVILLQLSQLTDARTRLGLTEGQWRLLGTHFDMAKRLEPTLVKSGLMPDQPAGKKPEAPAR